MYRSKYYNPGDAEKLILKTGKHEEYRKYREADVFDSDGRTHLHHIILQGANMQNIEEAVKNGCDVNKKDQYGMCALHYASRKGDPDIVEKLINLGADANMLTKCGTSPLMLSSRLNCTDVVERLLKLGVDVNMHNDRHETALHFAVGAGSVESVYLLLKYGAKVNYIDNEGITPLLLAVRLKHQNLVKILVNAKANLNYVDSVGRTPLHWASDLGLVESVEILINSGATKDVTDKNGDTPFICALKCNQPNVLQLLLDAGCDQHSVDGLMGTPVALASLKGFVKCTEVLLDAGADQDEVSFFGMTPLMLASFESKIDVVKLLLDRGANPNIESRMGVTALLKALMHVSHENESPRHEIISILLRAGADVNFRITRASYFTTCTNGRNCPLSFAISSGYLSLIKMLLVAGSKVTREEFLSWIGQKNSVQMYDTSKLYACIKDWIDQPASLKNICRSVIRNSLGERVYFNVNKLPLAKALKSFINFEEFDCKVIEKAELSSGYSTAMSNLMPNLQSCTLRVIEGSLLHSTLICPSSSMPQLFPYGRSGNCRNKPEFEMS